jgi:hypothetical protein
MIRTSMDPYGGCSPQVDKMIGDAYQNVEIVAKNIDAVVLVADNIDEIIAAGGVMAAITTLMTRVTALEAQLAAPPGG